MSSSIMCEMCSRNLTQYKDVILPVKKISYDRLISSMGFPILVRHFDIESGPRLRIQGTYVAISGSTCYLRTDYLMSYIVYICLTGWPLWLKHVRYKSGAKLHFLFSVLLCKLCSDNYIYCTRTSVKRCSEPIVRIIANRKWFTAVSVPHWTFHAPKCKFRKQPYHAHGLGQDKTYVIGTPVSCYSNVEYLCIRACPYISMFLGK